MKQAVLLYCIVLLLLCHISMFEECYSSSNWRLRSKVERPQKVNGYKVGVFTIKRGKQQLETSPTQILFNIPTSGHEYNLVYCQHCFSRNHRTAYCPLLECARCHEFGHASLLCKKVE
jgi:hypothetical protein